MSKYFARPVRSQQWQRAQLLLASGAALLSISIILAFLVLIVKANSVEVAQAVEIAPSDATNEKPVLVAAADIAEGTALKPELFRREFWPKRIALEQFEGNADVLEGNYAKAFLAKGQPLNNAYLTKVKTRGPLSNDIPKGYRAVTIRVNDISSVMGMIRPGELVDVSWVHTLNNVTALSVIVDAAKVLAVDQQIDGNWRQGMPVPGTATLLLDQEQRGYVQLASTQGQLILSLRNTEDPSSGRGGPIRIVDIPKGIPEEKKNQECNGRLRMCKAPGECEILCVLPNGSLVPIGPEYEPALNS